MRQIKTHRWSANPNQLNNRVLIEIATEPDPNGSIAAYDVFLHQHGQWNKKGRIDFHTGPLVDENGNPSQVTGISNEALLAIVIDRLEAFNKGPFSCRENSLALTKVQEALLWLQKRSRDREEQGIEGTLKP